MLNFGYGIESGLNECRLQSSQPATANVANVSKALNRRYPS
jgi:hypothetical protein